MKAELKNLKDQCDLNQLLLVERVEKIFFDEIEKLNKEFEKIEEDKKWINFLINDFINNIMRRHLEESNSYFNFRNYVDRVREYYHHHKKDINKVNDCDRYI